MFGKGNYNIALANSVRHFNYDNSGVLYHTVSIGWFLLVSHEPKIRQLHEAMRLAAAGIWTLLHSTRQEAWY